MRTNAQLIKHLKLNGVLATSKIEDAFLSIDRKNFVRPEDENEAYEDFPLSIGHGQSISQPYTVALMLELLEPKEGKKILDVGSGSSWTTALLGHIAGKRGRVIGTEIVPELVHFGQDKLARYSNLNAEIRDAKDKLGVPNEAPFDRILVSAGDSEVPQELLDQLKVGGVMVIPIGLAIWKVVKTSKSRYETEKHEGFAFVPLMH